MVNIRELYKSTNDYLNKEVTIGGWIRTVRDNKNFGFIELSDGTFFRTIQIVFDNTLENYNEIAKLNVGSAITIAGELIESIGSGQEFEVKAKSIVIEGKSTPDYPLQKKRHSIEYLRTIAHLRPRTNLFQAVFRVRSLAAFAIHSFFNERDFVYVNTPIITSSDCEGAGEMFKITTLDLDNLPRTEDGQIDYKEDFFGKMASLTVSGQLSGETFAMAFKNIYTFGPTFRAENSYTTRHAAEFWMMEPEMAFCDLNGNMDIAEAMTKYVIKYVLDHAKEEMEFFDKFVDNGVLERLNNLVSSDFMRITYTEAVDLLLKADKKFEYQVKWGIDLQTEHERYLTDEVFKKPVFVTNYPKEIKAFYMKDNDDGKTVAAMDLLVPGVGELMGGSQREDRLEILEKKILDNGMELEDYWWYLDLRRYGSVTHSGFGLGFDRLLMYLTGVQNIRDVQPYARTTKNAEF